MNRGQLTVLAVLAVIGVATTAFVLNSSAPTIASDRRGERVLPNLTEKANGITAITVRGEDGALTLARKDDRFVAANSSYPVKADPVRDLVASSAELTYEEARTSDPTRYADLGVADPGAAKGAGKEIVFGSANGEVADFIVGNRDTTVGGATGGEFIRVKGQPQTFLVRGDVKLPATKSEWFVPIDLDVKRNEIKKVELMGGGRDTVTASEEKPGQLKLDNVPEKRSADEFKVSRMATLVESFTFQDVRPETKPADDPRRLVVDAEDGLQVIFTNVGEPSEGWVHITAQANGDSKQQEKAKAIAAKVAGYDFRLPSNQAEILTWSLNDVTEEKQAETPPPGGLPPGGLPPGGLPPGIPPGLLQGGR